MAADTGESDVETDPYKVLGVPRFASLSDIRRAYRRRAREVHPDVGGSAEAFQRLTRAFAALCDSKSRKDWDAAKVRRKARERAARTWDDVRGRASAPAGGSDGPGEAGFRRARTRREAEDEESEASEQRRRRWREIAFDGVWREHMPLRGRPTQEARAAFVSAMEGAVQAYVDGGVRKAESQSLAARLDEEVRTE
jgi:curved DNA-binding protein CbpA